MAARITIDDVAKAAGVDKATVSRALNPSTSSRISAETVRRVRKTAAQLGYVPNAMARGLRTQSTMTVGVIVPDLTNPIFPPIVKGIEAYLRPRGFTALLASTDDHASIEAAAFESLLQRRVDGVILATGRLDAEPVLAHARSAGLKAVMVNRDAGSGRYPLVTSNNAAGIVAAIGHLMDLGHRRILHLAGPPAYSTTMARAAAFEAEAAARGLSAARIAPVDRLSIEAGHLAMDAILTSREDRPTAIIAANDLVAIGALRSMRDHGFVCPDDISIIGFNDMPFAADIAPPLTTVRVPFFEIGSEAARLLLAAIASDTQERVTVTLPVSLIVRGSTGRAGL